MPKQKSATKSEASNPDNQALLDAFEEYADLVQLETDTLEDQKAVTGNEFRLRSIRYVAKLVSKMKERITSGEDLAAFPRVGKKTVEKVDEFLSTGTMTDLVALRKKLKHLIKRNAIVADLSQVVGIGRSIANDLIDKHKVKSLEDLKRRVESGEIEVNDKVAVGLKYAGRFEGNIPRKEVKSIEGIIQDAARSLGLDVTLCGSYRRGMPTSNDVDVLVTASRLKTMDDVKRHPVLKQFVRKLKDVKLIHDDIAGDDITTKYMGFCRWKKNPFRRIDIRLMPLESFATALAYFTGSYELNRIMRGAAKKLGYKLNEYGLFDGTKRVPIDTEEELFKALGMDYLPPQERNIF
jgi:DNA polymerase beta